MAQNSTQFHRWVYKYIYKFIMKNVYFLNTFVSFGKKSLVISHIVPTGTYVVRVLSLKIILSSSSPWQRKDNGGKIVFPWQKGNEISVSKFDGLGKMAARNGLTKKSNGRKNLGKKEGECAVAVATPSAITML